MPPRLVFSRLIFLGFPKIYNKECHVWVYDFYGRQPNSKFFGWKKFSRWASFKSYFCYCISSHVSLPHYLSNCKYNKILRAMTYFSLHTWPFASASHTRVGIHIGILTNASKMCIICLAVYSQVHDHLCIKCGQRERAQ